MSQPKYKTHTEIVEILFPDGKKRKVISLKALSFKNAGLEDFFTHDSNGDIKLMLPDDLDIFMTDELVPTIDGCLLN